MFSPIQQPTKSLPDLLKKKLYKILNPLLFFTAAVILLIIAFRDIGFDELIGSLKRADYSWVLLSLFFATLAFFSRARRWKLLIEPLGYSPSFKNTFYALMTGYLVNFLLPRLGEVTRCGSLNRSDKIPVDALFGTVLIDRAFDVIMLLLVLFSVFIINIELFGEFIKMNIFAPLYYRIFDWLSFSAFIWGAIFLTLAIVLTIIWMGRKKLVKTRFFRFIAKTAKGIINGMKTVFKMEKKWEFIAHTFFIWLMYFLMTWVVFFSLPSTSELKPVDALFVLAIGGMGMSAPVQAGIGAYHWIVSLGLTLYEIPRTSGIVFATIAHESQALLMILLGGFSLLMLYLQNKRTGKEKK